MEDHLHCFSSLSSPDFLPGPGSPAEAPLHRTGRIEKTLRGSVLCLVSASPLLSFAFIVVLPSRQWHSSRSSKPQSSARKRGARHRSARLPLGAPHYFEALKACPESLPRGISGLAQMFKKTEVCKLCLGEILFSGDLFFVVLPFLSPFFILFCSGQGGTSLKDQHAWSSAASRAAGQKVRLRCSPPSRPSHFRSSNGVAQ